jgi:tetratricopeptide (TPR) repeat protein
MRWTLSKKTMSQVPSRTQVVLHELAIWLLRHDRYTATFGVLRVAHAHFLMRNPHAHDEKYTDVLDGLGQRVLLYGGPVDAERCFRASLKEKERVLPPGHWMILKSVVHIARALGTHGKFEAAEEWFRKGVEGCVNIYGNEHEKTLDVVWLLAYVVEKQGRDDEALQLYRRAYEGARKQLGDSHADTIDYWGDCLRLCDKLNYLDNTTNTRHAT